MTGRRACNLPGKGGLRRMWLEKKGTGRVEEGFGFVSFVFIDLPMIAS